MGLSSSLADIQTLSNAFDIIFLQETWLAKQNLGKLNYIADTHLAYGNYSVDFEDGILTGRPFGGTAVLWNKSLKVKPWLYKLMLIRRF